MIVSMWMTKDVVTIEPHTQLREAAALMALHRIRRLPVIEHHDGNIYPVGIVTATDIMHAYPPEVNPFTLKPVDTREAHVTAEHVMSRALQTVAPETPIEDAARIMRNSKISTLLVLQKMKLTGLITESDIFKAFVSILEPSKGDVRITFEITVNEDTFSLVAPVALGWGVRVVSMMSFQQADWKLCVVRLAGAQVDSVLNELWKSGHRVLNVLRTP
jgi:acetoin utilization protein AcuB